VKVDNYTATLPTPDGTRVFEWLLEALPLTSEDDVEVIDRLPTYSYAYALGAKVDGDVVAVVRWGGNGDTTSVDLKGSISHSTYGLLRAQWPVHRVTRMDVAVDRVSPGLFMRSYEAMKNLAGAKRPRVGLRHEGDWTWRDRPGLSCYFGSPDSDFQLVLYEKDAEMLAKQGISITDETRGWTRCEIRCRPKKRPLGELVAGLSPSDVIGLHAFGREALELFNGFRANALKSPPRLRSEERTYMALLDQYGDFLLLHPHRLDALADDLRKMHDFRSGKRSRKA